MIWFCFTKAIPPPHFTSLLRASQSSCWLDTNCKFIAAFEKDYPTAPWKGKKAATGIVPALRPHSWSHAGPSNHRASEFEHLCFLTKLDILFWRPFLLTWTLPAMSPWQEEGGTQLRRDQASKTKKKTNKTKQNINNNKTKAPCSPGMNIHLAPASSCSKWNFQFLL